jgi:hypothetical protein
VYLVTTFRRIADLFDGAHFLRETTVYDTLRVEGLPNLITSIKWPSVALCQDRRRVRDQASRLHWLCQPRSTPLISVAIRLRPQWACALPHRSSANRHGSCGR